MRSIAATLFGSFSVAGALLGSGSLLFGCGGDVESDSAEQTAGPGPSSPGPAATPADSLNMPEAGPTPVEGMGTTTPPGGVAPPPGAVPPAAVPPAAEPPAAVPPAAEPPAPALPAESLLGTGTMGGSGMSADRYANAHVTRDGDNYFFMANGWGPGFASQSVSWNGTSFTVEAMEGEVGSEYQPASYPTVFCGEYSNQVSMACGLPAPLSAITSLRTGWRWAANGNAGEYNAAYDIWMAKDDGNFGGFVMVWLRDPVGQQPAGSLVESGVTVENVPGTWNIWTGLVYDSVPIVNWVRATNDDSPELEFDVMDFVRDAQTRGHELPGTQISAVAVGFEIWEGPVTNLQSLDFYIDVQ